jgi:hypothetical protein
VLTKKNTTLFLSSLWISVSTFLSLSALSVLSSSLSASSQSPRLQVQASQVGLFSSRFFLRVSVVVCPKGISIYESESENQGYVGLRSYLLISARSETRIRTYDRL